MSGAIIGLLLDNGALMLHFRGALLFAQDQHLQWNVPNNLELHKYSEVYLQTIRAWVWTAGA